LVARIVRDDEAGGSNPLAPTIPNSPRCRIAAHPNCGNETLLAACGGSSGTASSANPSAAAASSAASAPGGKGKVDCATIKTAATQLLMIQFLAQLKTPDTIQAIKAKQIGNLDLDTFLAAMHDLHALDSYTSPLGDPKAAIDFYEKAGTAAKTLFATEPMTQAAIDTYNLNVGTVTAFLGHQIAITGALDAAGC
jgi:hypothetical protein